jgi:hypothetical protein
MVYLVRMIQVKYAADKTRQLNILHD